MSGKASSSSLTNEKSTLLLLENVPVNEHTNEQRHAMGKDKDRRKTTILMVLLKRRK